MSNETEITLQNTPVQTADLRPESAVTPADGELSDQELDGVSGGGVFLAFAIKGIADHFKSKKKTTSPVRVGG